MIYLVRWLSGEMQRPVQTVTTEEAVLAHGQVLGLSGASQRAANRLRGRPAEVANLAAIVRAEENDARWRLGGFS